jgi:hypothetical protein
MVSQSYKTTWDLMYTFYHFEDVFIKIFGHKNADNQTVPRREIVGTKI